MALGWRKEYSRYKSFFLNVVDFYKKKQELKMFVEVLLSMATIAMFAVFALKPTALTIIDLYKEIKAKEELIAKMDTKLSNLSTAQSLITQNQAQINLLNTAIPKTAAPETFVRQIEGASYLDSATLIGLNIGEVVLKGDTKKRPRKGEEISLPEGADGFNFVLSLQSGFDPLSNFLAHLEQMRRPLKIDTLTITGSKDIETLDNLNYSLSGQAPFFKEAEEATQEANQEQTEAQQ
jgi:hypothetical protein